jgi:hypothetical protein
MLLRVAVERHHLEATAVHLGPQVVPPEPQALADGFHEF